MSELGVLDLLHLAGFEESRSTKLVRHSEPRRYDLHDLHRRGWLEAYQAFQSKPVFDHIDYLVSFLGVGGTLARMIGVYRVCGRRPGKSAPLPPGCPFREWRKLAHFYELDRVSGFEHLEGRVIIDWGKGTRAWHQGASNRRVVEILPSGLLLEPFSDYLQFTLTHSELCYLCAHDSAHGEWRARLSAVAGIYLILATTTGNQYVGSAYGTAGIWGRWSQYARDGHGGNALLRHLIAADAAYPEAFTYSILQVLPTTFARAAVLDRERLFKKKLGSRATGLNAN